jgi:hypothetical protein
MRPYPVQLEVTSPARFDRMQLLLRVLISMALGFIGITTGWFKSLLYIVLPVLAAIGIGPKAWRPVTWLLSFSAYMLLLTDRFPLDDDTGVRIEMQPTGHPTPGSALLRLITSLPSAIAWSFLGFVSCVLWFVGAIAILIGGPMPRGILDFQAGFLRWQARLLAYHASLVDEYPPFSFGERGTPQQGELHHA